MIFWLEVDGKLGKYRVLHPYDNYLNHLNGIQKAAKSDEQKELARLAIRSAAADCVKDGKFLR